MACCSSSSHKCRGVCKKEKHDDSITPSTTPKPSGGCKDGYSLFGNYCYKVFEQKVAWNDALKACDEDSTGDSKYSLASIHSLPEASFVITLISNLPNDGLRYNTWIGGKLYYRTLKWSDNSEFDFNYWGMTNDTLNVSLPSPYVPM